MATLNQIKVSIIKFVEYQVKSNTTANQIYEQMANDVWCNEIAPFVKNENITSWEADIQKKFIDNPYVRFTISDKQAYCLARAYAALNPETINN